MRKSSWWQTLPMLVTVFRSVIFERFAIFVFIFWWLMTSLFALIVYWLDPTVAIAVLAFGAIMYPIFRRAIVFKKHILLREGDYIEYAIVTDEELVQRFKIGRLLRELSAETVVRQGLFDESDLGLYSQFYLVDDKSSNIVIPYEWVLGIELGLDEIEREEQE